MSTIVDNSGALDQVAARVPDFRTGELLDVREASTFELAAYQDAAREFHGQIGEAEKVVNEELLRRLDADATWTQRIGTGAEGYQFELHAASPTAGTGYYPEDELQTELDGLVDAQIISATAAEKALKRRLKLTVSVPWAADLDAMVASLKRATGIQIAGEDVAVGAVEPERKASASGIKALLKIPGAVQALTRALHSKDAPARRVKVTRHGRADGDRGA